ncbi:MAG: phosphohydrolase [Firmicutes bacterium]|nr:phosphohydrolase [Bacillota bacterium]
MTGTQSITLYEDILAAMTERGFLKEIGMSSREMQRFLEEGNWKLRAEKLLESVDERGRFRAVKAAEMAAETLAALSPAPETGWPVYTYGYVLGQLFPEKKPEGMDDEVHARGRMFYLQLLKSLFKYERTHLPFDPTLDMRFLRMQEIEEGGYHKEYRRFDRMARSQCIYEFMRIGIEITPWNTLGHIAGVHYVAMHVARQLAALNVPVDLGIVSGAAAAHDIGKYGCKKSEERRIPYLHYYYTDLCLNRFHMPMISHIAANHSTWDLELENLSVESLILIYADFRVKSSRSGGVEVVHFYSLAESFQVILDKLDNVDAAKELRYRRVYNKLVDFENYMRNLGVVVDLPEVPQAVPNLPEASAKKDVALLRNNEAVAALKHVAVDHNIRLMNRFYQEEDFASLLETARSEKQWKNLRTYVSIFGEYSTYMTEKQKMLTLKFLYELLAHRESDIRNQAGEIIGQIIARFNEEYKKELPDGARLAKKKITNLTLWEDYIRLTLQPDYKMTEQHKKWIGNSLKNMVSGLLTRCHPSQREEYIDALIPWFRSKTLTAQNQESLLRVATVIQPQWCSEKQQKVLLFFAKKIMKRETIGLQIAAVRVKEHYSRGMAASCSEEYYCELKQILGLNPNQELTEEALSDMFLDNMKARTPWTIKIANINLMLKYLETNHGEGQELHVATHLGNLVKVSETVTVRRAAGEGLVSIIGKMPMEQRNEIAVELGKGLEIGDYQFSKYIPNYLGIIMLHLPPQELDELIADLVKLLEASNGQVAAAVLHTFGVMLEHYRIYRDYFDSAETEETTSQRKYKLVNLILRGFANYNNIISSEALWTLGTHIFGSQNLSLEEKYQIFTHCGKKILTLYDGQKEEGLDFFNNAAVMNHIYRFITQYEVEVGPFQIAERDKVAFFPGTFDPFSLSHKAIATEIRNMGYEVYLALDEFSWSKKTQPRLQRRRLMSMSVADEEEIYIFPDDIPVNIANPKDLKRLAEIFQGRQLYFVAGSDVIENASCYRAEPQEDSIHSINHIIFRRTTSDISHAAAPAAPAATASSDQSQAPQGYPVSGKIINLHLEEYYEDISSTRIRENIDLNRDISNLIDPVAQNYIFENSLYLREPAYKHMIQARDIRLEAYMDRDGEAIEDMKEELQDWGFDYEQVKSYLSRQDVRTVRIRDGMRDDKVVALAAVSRLDSIDLLKEFGDQDIAAYIRAQAAGAIAVIGGLYYSKRSSIANLGQTILMEVMSELLARDYTYVVYHPCHPAGMSSRVMETLEKQGFINISAKGSKGSHPIYAVNMKSPVIIFKNVETIIKNPLNKNPRVLKAVEEAHNRLLRILTHLYPGELILSYNAGIMHHKMINLITMLNGVPVTPGERKNYGPYMAVPFGKVLDGVVVPNTVTKALHTEKYFTRDVESFTIEESGHYSSLPNQVRTIKSFNRPVILVDDLLHKGYRMKELDPILKENHVEVVKTVVGVQTGRGRDLMTMKERDVESAYFLPNLKCWIDEIATYPYLGGDSIKDREVAVASQEHIPSLNLILPFAIPTFLGGMEGSSIYDYSMACLENTRDILKTLEEEYQTEFERKLTIRRLGEVITTPKRPDLGSHVQYDENVAASAYVEKDIERLIRMRKMFK